MYLNPILFPELLFHNVIVLFRNRLRQYPAFVNCTTIDWFTEWPRDALLEVAEKSLEDVDLKGYEDNDTVRNFTYSFSLSLSLFLLYVFL